MEKEEETCQMNEDDMESQIPNEEYETQFFGFPPTDVYEGIKGLVKDRFDYTIGKLEQNLDKIPEEILSKEELKDGISKLRSTTDENIDNILTKFKKHLLENIMKIPHNLLLPEDAEHAFHHPEKEKETLLQEIEELKMQLKTEKYLEAAVGDELKDQEVVLKAQKVFLENQLSPSVRKCVEEERERCTFLAANASGLQERLQSLQQQCDARDLKKVSSRITDLQGMS